MPNEQNPGTGQPAEGASPGSDPQAQGILQGGITPAAEAALARLPKAEADLVRSELSRKNVELTKSRQALAAQQADLAAHVRNSEILSRCMTDPVFKEFVETGRDPQARAMFFRRHAGAAPTHAEPTEDMADNRNGTRASGGAEGGHASVQLDPAIVERLNRIERVTMETVQEREIREFQERHPDWQDYQPGMIAARSELGPNARLEHLYLVARGRTEGRQPAPAAAAASPAAQAAGAAQPPPATGGRPSASTPASRDVVSMRDAFLKSKEDLGVPVDQELIFNLGYGAR